MDSVNRTLRGRIVPKLGRAAVALLVAAMAAAVLQPVPDAHADVGQEQAVGGTFAINGLLPAGVTLSAPIGAGDTVIGISDSTRLAVGEIVQVDNEIMSVDALAGDGPGGDPTPDTMTVTRGQMGTTAASHLAGAALLSNGLPVKINAANIGPLPTGAALKTALDTTEFEDSGATLAAAINSSVTTLDVSTINPLRLGRTAKIDNEKMLITGITPGYALDSGADTLEPVYAKQRTIKISDKDQLQVGWTVEIETEEMTVDALAGDGPGGVQDTMMVSRAVAVDHTAAGLNIYVPTAAVTMQAIDAVQTTITISDKNQLQVGWLVHVDNEDMTVTALAGDGPGGSDDTMTVSRAAPVVHPYSLRTIYHATGATTNEPVYAVMRTIKISDKNLLQVGWTVRIDVEAYNTEYMDIIGLSGDGPGGADDFMTVSRSLPVDHTTAPLNIWGGQDRITVSRGFAGTTPASHAQGAHIWQNIRTVYTTAHTGLSQGITIQIDNEKMTVSWVTPGYSFDSGATLTADVQPGDTSIPVSNAALLQVGWMIKIDSEKMLITGLSGGTPGTATVTRAQEGSAAASHLAGATIWGGTDRIGAARGAFGTTIASHSAGAPINDVDGLGAYVFTLSFNTAYLAPGTVINESFLTSTGRTLSYCSKSWGTGTVTTSCFTQGSTPLGPTGSGTLATVVLRAIAVTGAGTTPADLVSGQLLDGAGDVLSSTVVDASLKIVKCADEDGNRYVNFSDAVVVAKAASGIITPLPKHDVDSNGAVNFMDAVQTAKLANAGTRCPPGAV